MTRVMAAAALALVFGRSALADDIELKDPRGDDNGPGSYTYPTNSVYTKGSFDLTSVSIKDAGSSIEIKVTVGAKIEDPWSSKGWGGNGFSLQMAFIFIDLDRKAGSGYQDGLPGLNVRFAEDSRWEKALIISPQGVGRLKSEISSKAAKFKNDIILPTSVRAQGTSIVAQFPKEALGVPQKSWGWQVLMQSNEGFPRKSDLLTRTVNEEKGEHRFGGGNDYDCDPHVIDMLAGAATGGAGEADEQHRQLKAYTCDDANPDGGTRAVIKMVTAK